jgi:dipeptidyl aminopeptidase/acylaminoacyl peptidase
MSSANQPVELCREESSQTTKEMLYRLPGPSWGCILLLMVCSTYGVCMSHAEDSGSAAPANQANSETAAVKRPVTVADFIQMTRFGDPQYIGGVPSSGLVAKFSPDGKRFVVVLRKGNLETNTNEYSLTLFATDEVFRSPNPRVLISMSSSSNRPAIRNVVWMDNDHILFLGENPRETTQLYSFQCSSRELKRLTNHSTNLSSFVVSASGGEIVFVAENSEVPFVNENSQRHGINVTSEVLSDLLAGEHGGEFDDHSLFVKEVGSETEIKITTKGRVGSDSEVSLSPDGLHFIIQTEASHVPDAWTEYDDDSLKAFSHSASASGARTRIFQYELVDVPTASDHPLVDAPIGTLGSEVSWSPDSQSVVVSNAYLPLDVDDAAERAERMTHTFLVEFRISSSQFIKISDEDLRLLEWDAKTNDVVCDVGRLDSFKGKAIRKVYFRRTNDIWSRSGAPPVQTNGVPSLPDIVLDESMTRPPRIFAIDPSTGRKSLLMDLNPQFQSLAFARVEEIVWKTSHKHEARAGLYWPVGYVAGKKYPLVIQTHGWNPDRFWIDGPWTTAFAAQALAGKGCFVLQVNDLPNDLHLIDTPREVPAAVAVYEGAIDFLDHRGLIDRDRVGITGFSRTYLYVTYALTHSKHHFAAADIADGVDYGYFQYMVFSNSLPMLVRVFDRLNGAPPFGKGLLKWLKVSPSFRMDKVETPLRIQALYPISLLSEWHWFSGLTRLGKPVEMIYILDGTHILEKPWDRMTSQQGNVDWFCFWLKGEEDPDSTKTEQYGRWRSLRALATKGAGASIKIQ